MEGAQQEDAYTRISDWYIAFRKWTGYRRDGEQRSIVVRENNYLSANAKAAVTSGL